MQATPAEAPPPPPMPVLDSGVRNPEDAESERKADAMIDSVFGLSVKDAVGEEGAKEESAPEDEIGETATEEEGIIQEAHKL